MMMERAVTEIDRLIEQGLSCYGEGDLDGALLLWERALVMDPENAQATSYVDYVRLNYQLLTGEGNTEHSGPFGIGDDDPEYQIEILPGEGVAPASVAPLFMGAGAHDEGWVIDDEGGGAPPRTMDAPDAPMIEIEADEPPLGGDPETFEAMQAGESVSFEDATREYHGGGGRLERAQVGVAPGLAASTEFVFEATPAFGSPEDVQTPQVFGSETTDVRRRDLGFVQPAEAEPLTQPVLPERKTDGQRGQEHAAAVGDDEAPFDLEAPTVGFERGPAQASLGLDLTPGSLTPGADLPSMLDLVGEPGTRPAMIGGANDTASPRKQTAREPPLPMDMPPGHGIAMAPANELPHATQLGSGPQRNQDRPHSGGGLAGNQPARRGPVQPAQPVTSVLARELGLHAARRAVTEEETTGHFEFNQQRAMLLGNARPDVPGMDPLDARSAEILEDIDRDAPAHETREDRTRRRIMALLEHATEWGLASDLERSVAAVDLALSEDPNSALAQKLIHRNRETIMSAFQGFLGDLQRTPMLARPLHELGSAPISPRAAFLLSRVDGTLSLDEILDVSGMPHLEAYRYLCQLFLRGILR
jgi:hypothetical protein